MSRKKAAEGKTAEKLPEKIKRSERSVKDYQFFILRLVIMVVALWLLFFVFIGVLKMPTADMYPRVDAGDLVLFYRLDKDVKAQDIIVIKKEVPGEENQQTMILRVVAVAGDTVDIQDDHLMINGNAVVETNIFYPTPVYKGYTEFPLTLQEGQCFVLADVRQGGSDSRFFGPVDKNEILGTVITIIRRNNL
jgi:signal peptidase I